jgi:hypothetical protein
MGSDQENQPCAPFYLFSFALKNADIARILPPSFRTIMGDHKHLPQPDPFCSFAPFAPLRAKDPCLSASHSLAALRRAKFVNMRGREK